jgi:hypothetical protein
MCFTLVSLYWYTIMLGQQNMKSANGVLYDGTYAYSLYQGVLCLQVVRLNGSRVNVISCMTLRIIWPFHWTEFYGIHKFWSDFRLQLKPYNKCGRYGQELIYPGNQSICFNVSIFANLILSKFAWISSLPNYIQIVQRWSKCHLYPWVKHSLHRTCIHETRHFTTTLCQNVLY